MKLPTLLASLSFLQLVEMRDLQLDYHWSHSLYAPYISIEGRNNNWDFDALISTYNFVQLTPEIPEKVGWAFTKEIFEKDNWVVEFFFRITGTYPADGMAFWFVEERFKPGTAFGYKENFKGLGVFFDVYKNIHSTVNLPWVSAMVGDGVKRFDHHSDGMEHQLAGCHAEILNTKHPVQAKVSFIRGVLEVALKVDDGDWKVCFTKPGVVLPRKGYIGFTAMTGGFAARHELYAVSTASVLLEERDYVQISAARGHIMRHHGYYIRIIGLAALVCGAIYLGVFYIKKKQKGNHFE